MLVNFVCRQIESVQKSRQANSNFMHHLNSDGRKLKGSLKFKHPLNQDFGDSHESQCEKIVENNLASTEDRAILKMTAT